MHIEQTFDEATNTAKLTLPSVVTGEDADSFADEILTQRNNHIEFNAEAVERFDTPCLEVLLAACKLWASDRCSVSFNGVSEHFQNVLSTLGFEQSDLETGVL